jgi:hypothetical protein
MTIYCFAHLHAHFKKKAMRRFIQDYRSEYFPFWF